MVNFKLLNNAPRLFKKILSLFLIIAVFFILLYFVSYSKLYNDYFGGQTLEDKNVRLKPDPSDILDSMANSAEELQLILEVLDQEHQPLENIKVFVVGRFAKQTYIGVTDQDGVLELTLSRSEHVLLKSLSYQEKTAFLPRQITNQSSWTLHLNPKVGFDSKTSFMGQVVCASGEVSKDAWVLHFLNEKLVNIVKVDSEGKFSLKKFSEKNQQRLKVLSWTEGFAEKVLEKNMLKQLTLKLSGSSSLVAKVVDAETGENIENYQVTVESPRLKKELRLIMKSFTSFKRGDNEEIFHQMKSMMQNFDAFSRKKVALSSEDSVAPFEYPQIAASYVNIKIASKGYLAFEKKKQKVFKSKKSKILVFKLHKAGVLKGLVENSAGEVIKGAHVVIRTQNSTASIRRDYGYGVSDANGMYEVPIDSEEKFEITVGAAGYLSYRQGGLQLSSSEQQEMDFVLTKDDAKDSRGLQKKGEFVGIGVQIAPSKEGGIRVIGVLPNSASVGQLKKGDIILRADGEWLEDLHIKEAIQHVMGEEGSDVDLLVKRKNRQGQWQELDFTLTRQRTLY